MPGPCSDLRVIDLSDGPVGGIATMVLADFGADVVKVERPGGDPYRRLAAAPMWLRGKRSVVLDLKTATGREALSRLSTGADAVVASFRPGRAAALGADPETLRAANPGLVYCAITGWGPRGSYANYPANEGLVAAKSGRMMANLAFLPRAAPYFTPVPVGLHATAQSALSGILAALIARERTGDGQVVETSLLQGMAPYDLSSLVRAQLTRSYPELLPAPPPGAPQLTRITLQYLPAQTSDGRWIQFANLMEHLFHAMVAAVGLSDIYDEPRFAAAPHLAGDDDILALRRRILARMRERPLEEWMKLLAEAGNVAAEPFTTAQQALFHPDLVANAEVVETRHPRLGAVRQLGLLARLGETPGSVGGPAPEVGEHTADVLAELGGTASPSPAQRGAIAAAAGPPLPGLRTEDSGLRTQPPLAGITVLEFATVIAVPLGAALLADLGARVIKVEPLDGDPYRSMGVGLGAHFGAAKTTASKESICIDLRSERGQEVVHRLASRADVVIHNYRPGVPERLGIGYEQLRALRPELIYVAAAGYGPDGPGAHRPAAHPIPGAVDGAALLQAGPRGAPSHCETLDEVGDASSWLYAANESHPDPSTSVVVASATLLALYARASRARSGRGSHDGGPMPPAQPEPGQRVTLSMLGANAYANADDFISYDGKPPRPTVDEDLYGFGPLYRLYPARSGWVFLGVTTDEEWKRFCAATGSGALLDDPRFAGTRQALGHEDALTGVLHELFAERDASAWEQLLAPNGVPCVRADEHSPGTFFLEDEQMHANGFAPLAEHALWGSYQRWAPAVTFSATPGRYGPGVLAGAQTADILAELGYSPDEAARLHADKIVASATAKPLPPHD